MANKEDGINKERVARLLEDIREREGLTLEEMARRVGVRTTTLHYYINDMSTLLKPGPAARVCEAYGISFEELAGAAGYPVGQMELSNEQKKRIIQETALEDWLRIRYNLNEATIRSIVSAVTTMIDIANM